MHIVSRDVQRGRQAPRGPRLSIPSPFPYLLLFIPADLRAPAQVLYSLIIALGARNSDHPALVGFDAPPHASLASATREGKDLRQFGRRREDACRALEESAVELADRMGTLRIASPENMASLM